MLNKKDRIIPIVIFSGSLAFFAVSLGRAFLSVNALQKYTSTLSTLKDFSSNEIKQLQKKLEMLEAKSIVSKKELPSQRKGDVSDSGSWARSLFTSHGLKIESYRTSTSSTTALFEFTLSGSIEGFIHALQDASEAETGPKVVGFRLATSEKGNISATVRIGYE